MLEWAEFAGNLYGTPRQPVLDQLEQGNPVLLEIELQGARQVRDNYPEAHLAFIKPPTWDDLVHRLIGRGSEDEATIERRLEAAKTEILSADEFDIVLINHSVEKTALELVEFARS
jgi:guanylate kinase